MVFAVRSASIFLRAAFSFRDGLAGAGKLGVALGVLALSPQLAAEVNAPKAAVCHNSSTLQPADLESWLSYDDSRWSQDGDLLRGTTETYPGIATDDPGASSFMVSRSEFAGEIDVEIELVFEKGRYLAVYLDYNRERDHGVWMATGHPLRPDRNGAIEVEMAYVKTVEDGDWTIRGFGQLEIEEGVPLKLNFRKSAGYYSVWKDDALIVSYAPKQTFAPGPLQLRIMSADVAISSIVVCHS